MVLLAEKLARSFKFHSNPEKNHHQKNSKSISASLDDFRSTLSNILCETLFKPGTLGSKSLSLEWFQNCFELISVSDRAFAKLLIEIEYPSSQWGGKATNEYLNYSLSFLEKLNSISSSISHINHAKISISHALSLIEKNSPALAAKYLKKIQGIGNFNPGKGFKVETSTTGIQKKPGSDQKERMILEAVAVLKKIGFLALGLVLSGLCSDAKLYLEIEKFSDDPVKKILDSGFCKEMMMTEIRGPVEEVNRAVERLSEGICNGKCDEAVGELKGRLVVLANCVQGVEKRVNGMFSEVLAAKNKLLDNIRFNS